MNRTLRAGPFVFRDPVLLCGVLYGLLWFDASGFLRIGLWAAFLHECGHVAAYLAMLHEFLLLYLTDNSINLLRTGISFHTLQIVSFFLQ